MTRLTWLLGISVLSACCSTPHHAWDHGAVVRGDPCRRELALVFTGDEFAEGSEHILDVLDSHGIHASFFVTGNYLAQPVGDAAVRRMVAAGHYVGPHSHGHLLYAPWDDRARSLVTRDEFRTDLQRNVEDLRARGALTCGETRWFIPPYEWFNRDHVAWAHELGFATFNFTPGSGSHRDWIPESHPRFTPSEQLLADILAFEHEQPDGLRGFLLLLHLGSERRDKMHDHLDALVRELKRRGYAFRRVDELLSASATE